MRDSISTPRSMFASAKSIEELKEDNTLQDK